MPVSGPRGGHEGTEMAPSIGPGSNSDQSRSFRGPIADAREAWRVRLKGRAQARNAPSAARAALQSPFGFGGDRPGRTGRIATAPADGHRSRLLHAERRASRRSPVRSCRLPRVCPGRGRPCSSAGSMSCASSRSRKSPGSMAWHTGTTILVSLRLAQRGVHEVVWTFQGSSGSGVLAFGSARSGAQRSSSSSCDRP
jgi:hypothetical protein